MSDDIPTPGAHARGWRLVSRGANAGKTWIDARTATPAMLLVLDTQEEWWAIPADCQNCSAPLIGALKSNASHVGLDEFYCAQCGTAHGHAAAGCECIALMVVDDEIYAAPLDAEQN